MLEINSGFNVQTQGEIRHQDLHNQSVQAVGRPENDPLRKDNETTVAITGTEKTENDGTENLYSHQRHQAIAALRGMAGKETPEDAAANDPAAPQNDGVQNTEREDEDTQKDSGVENDKKPNGEVMTDEEQEEVDKLKDRDQEVKTHEEAHMSAAGGLATGPYYEYENGPDGKRYATGGHVNIDTSEEDTPEKTISKMEKVIASANAPAEPSAQDRNVAAQARQTMMEARMELSKEQTSSSADKQEIVKTDDKAEPQAQEIVNKPKAGNTSSSMGE